MQNKTKMQPICSEKGQCALLVKSAEYYTQPDKAHLPGSFLIQKTKRN